MESRKKGIVALVLGFCSLYVPFFNLFTAGLAIAFGIKSKKTKGSNLGLIGLVLGICSLIINLTSFILSILITVITIVLCFFVSILPMVI